MMKNNKTKEIVNILEACMRAKMRAADVPFRGKKVFFDWQDIAPEHSVIGTSSEGGYVRAGLAIRLPELGRYLRFFVYWNDKNSSVDIDLHALAKMKDGEDVHIGWNSEFRRYGIIHSGDITHPDAAEYIDVDLKETNVKAVSFRIHSYNYQQFNDIETCFTGIMAVSELGAETDVKLYDPKNVLFSHFLGSKSAMLDYGILDLENRVLKIAAGEGKKTGSHREFMETLDEEIEHGFGFSLKDYMDMYCEETGAVKAASRDEADVILKPYKAEAENEVSILDNNYFLDAETIA